MTERRRDAQIMAAAMLVWCAIMLVHPPHVGGGSVLWRFSLSDIVHGLGLFTKPVLVYAFCRMAIWQGIERPFVAIALSFFVLGQIAMLSAGTVSGWITPSVFEGPQLSMHGAQGTGGVTSVTMQIARFSSLTNHGYAAVYTALVSASCLLWSLAWAGRTIVDQFVRVLGVAIGAGLLVWQLSGLFAVTAGSMVWVAAGHTIWGLAAATRLAGIGDRRAVSITHGSVTGTEPAAMSVGRR